MARQERIAVACTVAAAAAAGTQLLEPEPGLVSARVARTP